MPPNKLEQIPQEQGAEKLRKLEEQLGQKLNKEGVPVGSNCRINMDAFEGLYSQSDIEKDKKLAEEWEKEWHKGIAPEEIEKEKIKSDGEQFEVLKTIIFNKFLGEDFIVARASLYDDIKNKIDNVILDKKSGNLICAFDEVADASGKKFEEKKEGVLSRNINSSEEMKLKYGLQMKEEKIIPGTDDHFPLFYLALPPDRIKEAIKRMGTTIDEKTDYETKLFSYFISSIDAQIKALKLYPRLDQILKGSINLFEQSLTDSLKKFRKW